ncbi:MAG: Uma2 family endonuclease [Gemmatimonadaceae bacterium]|nr:Uma2 family endonuclease [Gemmatimonadaceae bacterium]
MAMPAPTTWTRDHVLDLMEHSPTHWPRYELVDGELLVTPAPRLAHQHAHSVLLGLIIGYVNAHRIGLAMSAPGDISLDGKSLLQPDIFVVPWISGRRPRDWEDVKSLLLVVEVLSPSTRQLDRGLRKRFYQRHGVPEFWTVDLDSQIVERSRPVDRSPEVVRDEILWQPEASIPALRIDLRALFLEVLGPDSPDSAQ